MFFAPLATLSSRRRAPLRRVSVRLKSVSSSSSRPVWTSNSSFIWSEISRCRLMECDRRSSWLSCSAKGLQSSPADETEQRTGHHLLLRLQHGIGLIGCLRVVGIRSVYRLCGRRGDQLRWRPHRLQAAERSRSVDTRRQRGCNKPLHPVVLAMAHHSAHSPMLVAE